MTNEEALIETMVNAGYHLDDNGNLFNGNNKKIMSNKEFFNLCIKRQQNKILTIYERDFYNAMKELNNKFPGIKAELYNG